MGQIPPTPLQTPVISEQLDWSPSINVLNLEHVRTQNNGARNGGLAVAVVRRAYTTEFISKLALAMKS